MLNFNSLLLSSENPKKLVEFYRSVLEKDPDWSDGGFEGFSIGAGYLTIGPHDKVKGSSLNPERVIFNFETDDIEADFERIKGLGALVIASPYNPTEDTNMKIATFADPDNNYFQLITPL